MPREYKAQGKVSKKTVDIAVADKAAFHKLQECFKGAGILLTESADVPESAGVPRIFMVKDGKVLTLEEGGAKIGGRAFMEALLSGQIFAYPAGEKHAVQIQADARKGDGLVDLRITGELDRTVPQEQRIPDEPHEKPRPRWYHKLFRFIPANRRLIEEYETEHEAWRQERDKARLAYNESLEEFKTVKAVEEKFGAARNEDSLKADKKMQEEVRMVNILERKEVIEQGDVRYAEDSIDIIVSLYRTHPQFHEEWVMEHERNSDGYYTRERFRELTTADIDPAKVVVGDKGLTEWEFAALAMFAATDVDISVKQQAKTVGDPTASIQSLQKAGYTEEQAKWLTAQSIDSSFTLDMLRKDSRMYKNFDPAVNGGRAKAAEALKAYPGDKTKLAEILSLAVDCSGKYVGVTGDLGAHAMAKLGGEMIALMDRDKELRELAKQAFDKRAEMYCKNTRIPRPDFDTMVKNIRDVQKFYELRQKCAERRVEILDARLNGIELTREQKRACLRDMIAGQMVEALRSSQVTAIENEAASPEGQPFNNAALGVEYLELTQIDTSKGIGQTAGGSSLPSSAPAIFMGALTKRTTRTPDIVSMVTKEAEMRRIMDTVDKIIEKDQLDKKSMDELVDTVWDLDKSVYSEDRLMKKMTEVAGVDFNRLVNQNKLVNQNRLVNQKGDNTKEKGTKKEEEKGKKKEEKKEKENGAPVLS